MASCILECYFWSFLVSWLVPYHLYEMAYYIKSSEKNCYISRCLILLGTFTCSTWLHLHKSLGNICDSCFYLTQVWCIWKNVVIQGLKMLRNALRWLSAGNRQLTLISKPSVTPGALRHVLKDNIFILAWNLHVNWRRHLPLKVPTPQSWMLPETSIWRTKT